MIAPVHAFPLTNLQRWHQQIGSRRRFAYERGERPHALLSYQIRHLPRSGLVPITSVTFVALFDEWQREVDDERKLTTRLLGFGAAQHRDGVLIGGPMLSRFDKDIRQTPSNGRSGSRLDYADEGLLIAALAWERCLERHSRHPHWPRRTTPKLPTFWCAVDRQIAGGRPYGSSFLVLLDQAIEQQLPLTRLLVDLKTLPKRQIIVTADPHRSLCGQAAPVTFDFYHSRFRASVDSNRDFNTPR